MNKFFLNLTIQYKKYMIFSSKSNTYIQENSKLEYIKAYIPKLETTKLEINNEI